MAPDAYPPLAANIEVLDDPQAKKREVEQLQFMSRIPKAAIAAILSSWLYYGYSFKCLLDAQASGISGIALTVGWLSFAMQLGNSIPPGTVHLLALSAIGKAKREPLLRLVGDQCPTVDVFIAYCGEDIEVLMDTVQATCALDYPSDRYRVVVLDDSVSATVKSEVEALRPEVGNVFYTTRGTKPTTHTKAANLNHGLKYVSSLPGGPFELVAVLDVDMIPDQHWLRALVPHIIVDAKVAMANPPQRHYNIPDGDPFEQSMAGLYEVAEPLKNATNSAWCVGTGFVVRRDALDSIGGIPEESISEDILTSIYLTAAGWRIVYVQEDVQWGLVPDSIPSYLRQQVRTYASVISTAAVLRGRQAQTMSATEKYGALFPALGFLLIVLSNAFNMVALPFALWSGEPMVAYLTDSQLSAQLLLFLIMFVCNVVFTFLASKAANFHLGLLGASTTWLIPYQFWTLVRFALSLLTGGRVPTFTPSGLTSIQPKHRLGARMKAAFWDDGFFIHVAIVTSMLFGLSASIREASDAAGTTAIWKMLLVGAAWPPVFLLWLTYIFDCWTPISSAFDPRRQLERKSLLHRNTTTQLARPTQKAKDQLRIRPSQCRAIIKIGYCVGICITGMYSLRHGPQMSDS